MPQAVEALYHDGIVELKRRPSGIRSAKTLVIFLDTLEAPKRHTLDIGKVSRKKSSVDKWIGVIEAVELGNWKAERRAAIKASGT